MQKLALIIAMIISGVINGQNYEQGMQKAFELWGSNQTTEAANLFERIANAEQDNWLPAYYAANINILTSFGEQDKEKLTAQLDKAKALLDVAKGISPNNPELMVLEALMHTAWVAYDGATYGMTLSPSIVALYSKAAAIAPNNPRVVFSKAEWDMGSARFFGQDTAPYCKDIKRAVELFDTFKPETSFHPNWGKERAEQVLAQCNQ